MKKIIHYILFALLPMPALVSCGNDDDDFTASIFDTTTPAVDPDAATVEFDQWLYDSFVVPYNVKVNYRFVAQETDQNYQVTPAGYEQSQVMARLLRYLFYQPYDALAGAEFMRRNSPREFQFVGSYAKKGSGALYAYAEEGYKITLRAVNRLNMNLGSWTAADVTDANNMYFHTMYHEFGHILAMRRTIPSAFRQLTPQNYDPAKGFDRDSLVALQLGFVSPYASTSIDEDFVEVIANIVTESEETWMNDIIDASLPGLRSGDKAVITALIDSLAIADVDDASKPWNKFQIFRVDNAEGSFLHYCTDRYVSKMQAMQLDETTYTFTDGSGRLCNAHRLATVDATAGDYANFSDYLNRYVTTSVDPELYGMSSLLRKLEQVTDWYTETWNVSLFSLRREVLRRESDINTYLTDSIAPYIKSL